MQNKGEKIHLPIGKCKTRCLIETLRGHLVLQKEVPVDRVPMGSVSAGNPQPGVMNRLKRARHMENNG